MSKDLEDFIDKRKIAIVGTGQVGSTFAFFPHGQWSGQRDSSD